MRWLKRPDVWFLLATAILATAATLLLHNPFFRGPADSDRSWFRWWKERYVWRSAFDATSAACGVGILAYDINDEYTAAGKWALTGIGLAGAALYLAAGVQATRRLRVACGAAVGAPPVRTVLLMFLALALGSVVLVAALTWAVAIVRGAAGPGFNTSAWGALSAFGSLGWLPNGDGSAFLWVYLIAGLIGGLGWTVWLLPLGGRQGRYVGWPRVLGLTAGYLGYLLAVAAVLYALEAPRGQRASPARPAFTAKLLQVTSAGTSGLPVPETTDRGQTNSSHALLGSVILVGGLGGAPGGGLKFPLLVWGLAGLAAVLGRRPSAHPVAIRCLVAGAAGAALIFALTLVVCCGLLIIENRVSSAFQSRPSFADAWLDACCAVGGANLTAGVIATVTSPYLSSGIRQAADVYQYGMAWLIGAMLLGRVLPLFVLCRVADLKFVDVARGSPPEP